MIRVLAVLSLVLWAASGATEPRVPQSRSEIGMSFVAVVRTAAPAVVNIYARRVVDRRSDPFRGDPFFQDLFRDFGAPRTRVQNALGSGVVVSRGGFVVSNFHVVAGATDIRVVLNDRREFSAQVVLTDEDSDLAVLRLQDAPDLPVLELRDSDTVEVGELVLAIGNPFGVGQTVSSGIVSGLARSGTAGSTGRGYFIQTDAPINPGNSGGALVDVNGRLIGINTAILSRSGGSNGIGFAVPSALVAQVVAQAAAGHDRFRRPWAGIGGQAVGADMAEALGLARPEGLAVSQLHPESPFDVAGLVPGDVIVAVDGQPVNTPAEMIFRMSVTGLGAEARVTVLRDGVARDLRVAMIAAPEVPPRATIETGRRAALPGMVLSNINPAVIAQFDLPLMAAGVVIEAPGQGGLRAGLRPGDMLRAVGGRAVPDTATAAALLDRASGLFMLEVQRGGRRMTLRFRR